MTNAEIEDVRKLQAGNREFAATPLGSAFRNFDSASGAMWRAEHEDMSHAKATRLDSAHREAMDAFRSEVDSLFDLIYRLSDALTDEGPDWSNDGLDKLRCDVARALPKSKLPEWLERYSHGDNTATTKA